MAQDFAELLQLHVVAVVGCSPKEERASFQVASYLKDAGYRVIPVNPNYKEVLGEKCYPNLKAVPGPVEVVNIFRKSEEVPAIVDEAIAAGAKGIWMQDGIDSPEAVEKARGKGLKVVVNDCFMRRHVSRLGR